MLTDVLHSFKSNLHSTLNRSDRRAKIQDADFISALQQAMATAKEDFSLADLRRSVCTSLDTTLSPSAFNERLGTTSLRNSLQDLATELIPQLTCNSRASRKLLKKIGVSSIIGIDASMVSLWDGLSEHFKGTFVRSALKLHLSMDLTSGAATWFKITPGATHDSQCFPEISPGTLHIFDLGYWSGALFGDIMDNGAFFLSRLKSNTAVIITEVVDGMGQSIVGHDLLSFPIQNRRKQVVELKGIVNIKDTDYELRVFGFWHAEEKVYRWYLSNLECDSQLIYELYRLRWQIELSFKAMKSSLNLARIPTLNPNTALSLMLVSLINYIFTTAIREEARAHASRHRHPAAESASTQRAGKVFRSLASAIFDLTLLGRRLTLRAVDYLQTKLLSLVGDFLDPNYRKRKPTLVRLQGA